MVEAIPGSVRSKISLKLQEFMCLLNVDFVEPTAVYLRTGNHMSLFCSGMYEVVNDIVSVKPPTLGHQSIGDVNTVLLHELVHWSGHPSRVNREEMKNAHIYNYLTDQERHQEEACAQIGMYKLCKYFCMDMVKAEKYLSNYLITYPLADLGKAEADAEAAVSYLLSLAYGEVRKVA